MALIRMRLQKALPLLQHQHVQKTTMVLFHLLFQISKEKLLCSLQSLPTLLSLYHEGFACSHLGVSSFWFSCFHVNRDTPSLLLHTTPYTTPWFKKRKKSLPSVCVPDKTRGQSHQQTAKSVDAVVAVPLQRRSTLKLHPHHNHS